MRLIDRLRPTPEAARADLPEWQTGYYSTWGDVSSDSESVAKSYQSYATDGYQGNAVVFAVLLSRLSLFSEAVFKFHDEGSGNTFGTSALSRLENPWPGGSTRELLVRMIQDADLAGNAFVRDTGSRYERLRPDWVEIVSGRDLDGARSVVGYLYRRGGGALGDADFYPVDEVAHWSPIPDPLAEWRGMSWLTPVVREINADTAMTEHKKAFMANAATPNMIIKYAQKLNDDAIEKLAAQWQATHGGPRNGWKTAVLDNGADPTIIGHSFEQMNFATVQAAGENRIAAAGGVPGIVVGLKEGLQAATYSNYEQAMRRYSDMTMIPLWGSVSACLGNMIDVPAGSKLIVDTRKIAALRQGEMERAQTFKEKAFTATELIRGGYDPDTVASAVDAGDLSLLQHTGAVPTALYPDGKTPATGGTT